MQSALAASTSPQPNLNDSRMLLLACLSVGRVADHDERRARRHGGIHGEHRRQLVARDADEARGFARRVFGLRGMRRQARRKIALRRRRSRAGPLGRAELASAAASSWRSTSVRLTRSASAVDVETPRARSRRARASPAARDGRKSAVYSGQHSIPPTRSTDVPMDPAPARRRPYGASANSLVTSRIGGLSYGGHDPAVPAHRQGSPRDLP